MTEKVNTGFVDSQRNFWSALKETTGGTPASDAEKLTNVLGNLIGITDEVHISIAEELSKRKSWK